MTTVTARRIRSDHATVSYVQRMPRNRKQDNKTIFSFTCRRAYILEVLTPFLLSGSQPLFLRLVTKTGVVNTYFDITNTRALNNSRQNVRGRDFKQEKVFGE